MRADLPSGTVTFLFTDIEGSTGLLDELGPGIIAARGNPTDATTLLAAASTIRALTGAVSSPVRRAKADTVKAQCREALSPEAFARAWEEGASLDAMAAADWALRFWEETE